MSEDKSPEERQAEDIISALKESKKDGAVCANHAGIADALIWIIYNLDLKAPKGWLGLVQIVLKTSPHAIWAVAIIIIGVLYAQVHGVNVLSMFTKVGMQ